MEREDLWRHSKWCEFIYQRLVLAKDLLREDGVIFVSIDDNEMPALSLLMKRVFGEANFVGTCVWQKRYSRENRETLGDAHEYVVVYARNAAAFKPTRGLIPLGPDQAKVYKNLNRDPKGPWATVSLNAQGYRPNQMYVITAPNGKEHRPPEGRCWALTEPEFLKLIEQDRVHWGSDGNGVPRLIRYLSEVDGLVPWTWWPHEEVGHTDEARKEIRKWLGTQTAFDTPKPVRLLERVLRIGCGPNDLVLDFFAGSGTTGHAVLKLNAEDGGSRRFILVSNTEATEADPAKNLCRDVCAERVRRVIAGHDGTPGTGGDFAYLRCRRVPAGRLAEIDHAEVWTALQLVHADTLSPFVAAPVLTAGTEEASVLYVPRVSQAVLPKLQALVDASRAVTLYSWQPEFLREHVRAGHVQHEGIPESLARRFGWRGGA